MSMIESFVRPAQDSALGAFWHNIRAARQRPEPATPRTMLRHDRLDDKPLHTNRAANPVRSRRPMSPEKLMDSYFSTLASGSYPFRKLKDVFDGLCEEAELVAITDKRFAMWLQDRGAVRKRMSHAKITNYIVKPKRRRKAAQ